MGVCLSTPARGEQDCTRGQDLIKAVPKADTSSLDASPGAAQGTLRAGKDTALLGDPVEEPPANAVTNPDTDLILNMLDPENGPAAGLPYQVHWLGPPRPPCEAERLATVMALGKIKDNPDPDPEIATILKLVANIFKCPAALCALFDQQRVFISEQEGNVIPCGDFPWRWTLCGWSMAFKNPQVLVIQDTLEDARFRNNQKVTVFPKVRFYCGAPLVASNGHRLGTLCFADVKPRRFDMASCVMMNNLSELVVRQLEKDIALKLKEADNKALASTYHHLQRAVDSYEHCVVLLDTTEPGWRVVYANSSWSKLTGLPRESLVGRLLCDVLEATDGMQLPSPDLMAAAANLKAKTLNMARVKDPSVTKTFKLAFKPAGRHMLDASTLPIGVPSFLPPEGAEEEVAHKYYFLGLYPPSATVRSASTASSILAPVGVDLSGSETSSADGSVLQGLELAHLLGRGSWGWVYYGSYYGTPVAVKVIDEDSVPGAAEDRAFTGCMGGAGTLGPTKEAAIAHELRHPNIVSTLTYANKQVPCNRAPTLSEYTDGQMGCGLTSGNICLSVGGAPHKAGDSSAQIAVARPSEEHSTLVGSNPAWAVIEASPELEEDAPDSSAHNCRVRPEGWNLDSASHANTYNTGQMVSACKLTQTPVTGKLVESGTTNTCGANTMNQTWMVMEFCDRGCLQDAIDRGWLRTQRDCLHSLPNMPAVLACAIEMAGAMAYLHAHDIVHGDLTGWNVMLSSAGPSTAAGNRGFVTKVADFGMSRSLELKTRLQTRNYGTITHMPPELLSAGTVSKSVDVWSFGVLMWQMVTGSRPWSGLTHAQVIFKVVNERQSLVWGPEVPAPYLALGQACLSFDPADRPSFDDIVRTLEGMRDEDAE